MIEGPYKLPEGWRWVRLGEVCNLYQPKTITVQEMKRNPGPYPVFGANGIIGNYYQFNHEESEVLVTCRGATCGTFNMSSPWSWITGNAMVVTPVIEGLRKDYLYWVIKSTDLREAIGGSAQPQITRLTLSPMIIPLPPLDEQRRIVARIEELMERVREAKRLRQQAKEDADRLWQAALAETFPRPGTEPPPGWRWVRLGEVFEVQQGASMSPQRRLGRNPKPFLRTRNILWGTVDTLLVDEMDFTDEEAEKLSLQPGDLLVCEGGDVGRTAIWEGQLPTALFQNHIHRLRAKDAPIEPRFIMYWMQAAYQVFLAYQGEESRTAIPNLSGRRLKAFLAPLPPLEEQRRIVTHLEAVQEKVNALKEIQATTDAELQRLEQAILDRAFRGEL